MAPLPAPQNLVATPGQNSVGLTWDAVNGASGYDIYRSTASGQRGSLISGPGVPSGRANLPDFTLISDTDFPVLAAEGSMFNSSGVGQGNYSDWRCYPSTFADTAKTGHYSSQYISVVSGIAGANGNCMRFNMHKDSAGAVWGAAPYPLIANNHTSQYQTYGRYEVRVKASAAAPGWHIAWLLWPLTDDNGTLRWPQGGETDFPEADLTGNIGAFMHWFNGTSGGSQSGFSSNIPWTQWNTVALEWRGPKGSVTRSCEFFVNGTSIGKVGGLRNSDGQPDPNFTKVVPNPMRWVLQSESKSSNPTAVSLYIDYASAWSWTPGTP